MPFLTCGVSFCGCGKFGKAAVWAAQTGKIRIPRTPSVHPATSGWSVAGATFPIAPADRTDRRNTRAMLLGPHVPPDATPIARLGGLNLSLGVGQSRSTRSLMSMSRETCCPRPRWRGRSRDPNPAHDQWALEIADPVSPLRRSRHAKFPTASRYTGHLA